MVSWDSVSWNRFHRVIGLNACCRRLFKVPWDCFRIEHCSYLVTCFVRLFRISHSYSRLFQFNGIKQLVFLAYRWWRYSLITYILVFSLNIAPKTKDTLINIITTSKRSWHKCLSVRGTCVMYFVVSGTDRKSVGTLLSSVFLKDDKRLLLRFIHHLRSDCVNNMDHMRISGTEPSSVIHSQTKY